MSNKKLPKFLICTNPMVGDSTYILHTQTPRFIAEVNGQDILVIQDIDYMMPNAPELAKIMSRMGDWYVSYLKFKRDGNRKDTY
jgi:hypothetical protein